MVKVASVVSKGIFLSCYAVPIMLFKFLDFMDSSISGPTFVMVPAPMVNTTSPGSKKSSK